MSDKYLSNLSQSEHFPIQMIASLFLSSRWVTQSDKFISDNKIIQLQWTKSYKLYSN